MEHGRETSSVPSVDVDDGCRKVYEDNSKVFQNNISPDDVADYYTTWAADYEKVCFVLRRITFHQVTGPKN